MNDRNQQSPQSGNKQSQQKKAPAGSPSGQGKKDERSTTTRSDERR